MNKLPELFEERMRTMLGGEFDDYLSSFLVNARSGIRINTLKCSPEEFLLKEAFDLRQIPWIHNGFFYSEEVTPSKHPFYYAGLYYIQEPSAMTPANLLPVKPGDKVLDLCAAPGGKSTELAAKLNGTGLLVANDISNSRAKALLKNLELFGVRNAIVSSEPSQTLAGHFPEFFDCILVDAPCSGEGMFRKQPAIMKNWEQYGTGYYSKLQHEILPDAVKMLRPGGKLMYSTCTFSPEEDEELVAFVLKTFPEMNLIPCIKPELEETYREIGFTHGKKQWMETPVEGIEQTVRLFPHKIEGEGHFLALFEKTEEMHGSLVDRFRDYTPVKRLPKELLSFLETLKFPVSLERIYEKDARYYLLPEGTPALKGLRLLRSGLLLGEYKKDRFEPSQALASSLREEDFANHVSLSLDDSRVLSYLKCETVELPEAKNDGYVLLCVEHFSLGWVKKKGSNYKNKYLPGWRLL